MLTSRRPASFGTPVEPEVNNLSAARDVSPPSGWREASSSCQTMRRRAAVVSPADSMTPSNVGGSSVASNVGGATTAVLPAAQQPMSAAASSKPSLRLSTHRSPSRPRKRASTLAAAAQSSLRRRSPPSRPNETT